MVFGEIFFSILEIAGTVSFAISGAMAALEKKVDLFGVIVLGITTALAGGIFRDMLVGRGTAVSLFRRNLYEDRFCNIGYCVSGSMDFQ